MNEALNRLLDRFAGLSVAVIGDSILDVYMEGPADKLSAEAPVPVVRVASCSRLPGGAANTAVNVKEMGGRPSLVSAVGEDPNGGLLRGVLEGCGIGTGSIVTGGRPTLAMNRVVSGSHIVVRFDIGSSDTVEPAAEKELACFAEREVSFADAVIVSDYGYGAVCGPVVEALAAQQAGAPKVLVIDSRHPAAFRRLRPTAVKPNWREALQILGTGKLDGVSERADGIAAHGDDLLEMTGAQIVAVTLDSEGAIVFEKGHPPHRTFAPPSANSVTTSGAGDTFVVAFAMALAAGAYTPMAAEVASAAADVVVKKNWTAACSLDELRAKLAEDEKWAPNTGSLVARLASLRRQGRRIVFTNGCFDILHRGHITYLNRAKTLGDVLIVAMNDDEGVRRLKGPSRPVNRLEDRAEVLAALSCVDLIVPFYADTPVDLLKIVNPDIYVKGGDYKEQDLPEAGVVESLGGSVEILPFMEDHSTSGIIKKIEAAGRNADETATGR